MAKATAAPKARDKWIGVAAGAIILIAVIVIYRMYSASQVQVAIQINAPPGSSEKMQAMKAQGGASANAGSIDDSPSDRLGGGTGSPIGAK